MWYRDFAVLEGFLLVKFKRKNTNLAVVILVPLSRQRVNWFRTVGTGVTPKYCVWTSRVSENCAPGICEHVSAPNVQGRLRYCFYSTHVTCSHVQMFMFGAFKYSNTSYAGADALISLFMTKPHKMQPDQSCKYLKHLTSGVSWPASLELVVFAFVLRVTIIVFKRNVSGWNLFLKNACLSGGQFLDSI